MSADQSLRSRSRFVAGAFILLALLYLLFGPLTLIYLPKEDVALWMRLMPEGPISTNQRMVTLALNVPQILFEVLILCEAARIFARYAGGQFFSEANVLSVRKIGLALMILPFLTAVTRLALDYALAGIWPAAPEYDGTLWGLVNAMWDVTVDYIVTFLIGVAVFLFADTQARAAEVEAENAEIV